MSLSQLEKYLRENPVIAPTTPQKRTVILVSGSKGNYLKRHICRIHLEKNIIFESKGGRNSKQAVDLTAANVHNYRRKYGNILLILWTGTCDLTSKLAKIDMKEKLLLI